MRSQVSQCDGSAPGEKHAGREEGAYAKTPLCDENTRFARTPTASQSRANRKDLRRSGKLVIRRYGCRASSDCETRRGCLSGSLASLVVVVPRVTRRVTGRFVCALGMICPRVCGGAGLASAAGLIRSLSARRA